MKNISFNFSKSTKRISLFVVVVALILFIGKFFKVNDEPVENKRTSIDFQPLYDFNFHLKQEIIKVLDAQESSNKNGNIVSEEIIDNKDSTMEIIQEHGAKESIDPVNEEMLHLVNELRANKGVEPLTYDPILQYDADIRAKEGTILRGHERPDENGNPSGLYPDSISGNVVGENLAYSNAPDKYSVSSAYEAWCASTKGHYEAMFNSKYHTMAVSVFTAENGNVCWALVFGN